MEIDGVGMSDVVADMQAKIEERLAGEEPEVEVIAVERAGNERLRMFIDHPDGVTLELCERVTKRLPDVLERWGLEVSSPGPERPLTKPEHFQRFLGQTVRVKTSRKIDGRSSFTGELTAADAEEVKVVSPDGEVAIPFDGIHRSNLVPTDINEESSE
jgi:ribosome maturation factor RimP